MKKYARKCDECQKVFDEGYCIEGGCEYYCSDKCLHKHITKKEFKGLYNNGDGDSYWTTWECPEDMQYYEDGTEIDEEDDGEEKTMWVIHRQPQVEGITSIHSFIYKCDEELEEMYEKEEKGKVIGCVIYLTDNEMKQLKEKLNKDLSRIIKLIKKESENELKNNNTTYQDVLNSKDTKGWGVDGENNNFSAGKISACKEILKEIEK